jgi:hypothetical protein
MGLQRGYSAFIKAVCEGDTAKALMLRKYGASIDKEDDVRETLCFVLV